MYLATMNSCKFILLCKFVLFGSVQDFVTVESPCVGYSYCGAW